MELLKDGASFDTKVTDTANGATGCTAPLKQFSADIPLNNSATAYAITAKATDAADNTSAASDALSITVDATAPAITATVGGTIDVRTVKGVDTDTGTTTWKYKPITSGTTCDAAAMSGASDYTEDTDQTIGVTHNGKKVCFSSTDVAGNVGYAATSVLTIAAALTATVGTVPSGAAQSKDVAVSAVTAGATVQYNLITDALCNETNYGSGGTAVTLTNNAGSVTVTNETDNNKYLCFKVTKTNFSDQYFGSTQITGIDDTVPTVSSSAYYSNSALTTDLSGNVVTGSDIYTKVTFSENMTQTTGTGNAGRPVIKRKIGSTETQYAIVAAGSTLTTGQCMPNHATNTNVYACRYTVAASDGGAFTVVVDTDSSDLAGNNIASKYTNTTTLTLNPVAEPTVTYTPADGGYITSLSGTVMIAFSASAYSDSSCNDELTNTTAGTITDLRQDNATGTAITHTVTYSATNDTITLTPSSDLTEDWTVYAALTNGWYYSGTGGACTQGSASNATMTVDATAPTVTDGSTGYYGELSLTNELSGSYKSGKDIYTKVTFSEAVKNVPSNTASARPELFYRIGSTDTQYDIISSGTPDDGDCIESGTGNADEKQYSCRYTVKSTDSGSFAVKVGTNTTDKAGNALSLAYTHATTLTLDNTVPTISSVLVDGTTLTLTMSENVYAASAPVAGDFTIVGGGTPTVNAISGLENSILSADNSFTLTIASALTGTATLSYRKTTNAITDVAGNALADLTGQAIIAAPAAPTLALHSPSSSPGNDSTPTIRVTVDTNQQNGTAELFSDSSCASSLSDSVTVDAAYEDITVSSSNALTEGSHSLYAKHTNSSNQSTCSTTALSYEYDNTVPIISSVVYHGTSVILNMSEQVYGTATADDFTVTDDGTDQTPSGITIGATKLVATDTITLTVASIASNSVVTIDYSPSGSRYINDRAGNVLASVTDKSATEEAVFVSIVADDDRINATEDNNDVTISGSSAGIVQGTTITVGLDGSGTDVSGKTGTTDATGAWSVTILASEVQGLGEGSVVITASASGATDGTRTITYDATAPTISSSAYYSNSALTTDLSGNVVTGADIYTKITFSENMTQTTGTGSAGRPVIKRKVKTTETQYDIVAAGSTLGTDECMPNHATNTNVYACRHTVTSSEGGAFTVVVDTDSKDLAGNAVASKYTNTTTLTLNPVAEPTVVYSPLDDGITKDNTTDVTIDFSAAVYSDSNCATAIDNTSADTITALKITDNNGNAITHSVTYDSTDFTITLDPTANLADGDVYVSLSDAWYYSGTGGACTQGSASNATFEVDTAAPTVSSVVYRLNADDTENLANAGLTDSFYSIVSFSEQVTKVEATDSTARPEIKYQTSSSASAVQYDIVAAGSDLSSGECKPNSTGTKYSCKYTGTGLSGTNLFKTYITAYTDIATNAGTAQTYDSNAGGVTIANNVAPTLTYNPADSAYVGDNTTNITITASSALYADSSGTAFTDTTIDALITLKEDDASGDDIAKGVTISGNVITIDPNSNLEDGTVYVAISNGWYYGLNPTKSQGTASNVSFTVDTAVPTVSSVVYRATEGGSNGFANAGLTDSFYSVVTFSEVVTKVESDGATARPKIVYRTNSGATETQYDIVAAGSDLSSGDCKPNATGTAYTCMYTGLNLSGSNLFKSYVTDFTNLANTAGTAQSYSTNAGGVTIANNVAPTLTYSPADDADINTNTTNITITASGPIYKTSTGTAFSNTDIGNIISLKTNNSGGTDIAKTVTISGNVITIDPTNNLADGDVYVAISNGWYYGANPTKSQGTASNATFTMDTAAPSVSICCVSGNRGGY